MKANSWRYFEGQLKAINPSDFKATLHLKTGVTLHGDIIGVFENYLEFASRGVSHPTFNIRLKDIVYYQLEEIEQ